MKLIDLKPGDHFNELLVILGRKEVRDISKSFPFSHTEKPGIVRIDGQLNDNEIKIESFVYCDICDIEPENLPHLFPASRFETSKMQHAIEKEARKHIQSPNAIAFLNFFFSSPEFKKFIYAPAAMSLHHAFVGGLLEHTLSMLRIGIMLSEHYEIQYTDLLNRDLLLCGVLMHDFMKVSELKYSDGIRYTSEGNLLGHIVMGHQWIQNIEALDPEFKIQLQHLVLSHHGKKEYGSPIEPASAEAFLLHQIDMMDSRMNMVWNLASSTNEEWTRYSRTLGTRIYLGKKT